MVYRRRDMKIIFPLAACLLLAACGDKDEEDTAAPEDTAAEE
jgi:uncharacterized lipoprotein YajG